MEEKKEEQKNLSKEFKDCQKKVKEYLEGWQRERANFLNYKKKELERFSELVKYANEELILKILPVLDNLERAEKDMRDNLKEKKYAEGISQIKKQFRDILKNEGVTKIECLGKKFDARFHEVVGEVEGKGKEKGIIIEEILPGYMIHDKLLRPSKVKVSR